MELYWKAQIKEKKTVDKILKDQYYFIEKFFLLSLDRFFNFTSNDTLNEV